MMFYGEHGDHLTMRNLEDGSYAIHCTICKVSLVPDLPMSMIDFSETCEKFALQHSHDNDAI